MIWLRAFLPTAIALIVAAALAYFVSDTMAARWLAIALVIQALLVTLVMARLYFWAALPRQRALPQIGGVWQPLLESLTAELEQLHRAVDRLPDGLVVLDRYDHVQWCNDAAHEMHGIVGTGRPLHHFIRQLEFINYLDGDDYSRPQRK